MKRFAITWQLPNGSKKTRVYRSSASELDANRHFIMECGKRNGLDVIATVAE